MTLPGDAVVPMDPQRLREILQTVHDQVAAALWLSAGMILAVGSIACMAVRWRRAALAFGLLYSASLCFVHNGHAQVLGPAGCAIASAGLFWSRGRNRRNDPTDARQRG